MRTGRVDDGRPAASRSARWSLAVVVVAVLLLRRRRHAHVQAASSRTPASSSRTTTCRSAAAAIGSVTRDRADRQQPGRDHDRGRRRPTRRCTRARRRSIRATSLSGIANRYIALTPGPNSDPKLADGGDARRPTRRRRRRPRPALQHARPEDAQGAAAASSRASRDAVRRHAASRPTQAAKYFNPALLDARAGWSTSSTATSRRSTRFVVNTVARRSPRSPSAATTSPNLVTQREHDGGGDRRRERRRSTEALALLPEHAAPGQHDVREPARDARRPRRAGRRVQAGDEGPRAVPARAAPARRTTRARRSPTCAR